VAFPPGVDDSGDLVERLLLEVHIVFRGFNSNFVGAISGCHLKHPDSPETDLRKDAESGKLVGYNAGEPPGTVWGRAVVADSEYLRRRLIFFSVTKRTSRSGFRRLFFASRLGSFGPLRSG
jgi:hypothetical protein